MDVKSDNTSEVLFEVFKEVSDHFAWEKHIEFALRYPGLTEEQRKKMEASLKFLQLELGNTFLKVSDRNHPLFRRVTEKGVWRATDLIAFVQTLQTLKENEGNCSKLISKIVSKHNCETEGMPFTEIAAMYLRSGFKVRILDETQGQKNPDMLIIHPESDRQFYIEVSKLEESGERRDANRNYKMLYAALNYGEHLLPYSCCQLAYISDEEMPAVLKTISKLLERATLQKEFLYHTDDKIRLGVAHADKYAELEAWIESNDYRKGLLGLPLNFNETRRIANYKIQCEAEQIPPETSGLIYLPVNTLYFWDFDLEEAASYFQDKMKEYKNILGIVAYGYLINDIEPVHYLVDGHVYSVKRMNDAVIRHLVFVRNRYYSGVLTEDLIKAIYGSFE